MAHAPVSDEKRAEVRRVFAETGNKTTTAKRTGVHRQTVIDILKEAAGTAPPAKPDRLFRENNDDTAVVVATADAPVKTLADALRVAEVDQTVWEVDHWEVSDWTVPMKVEQGQDAEGRWRAARPIQTQQYRVKVYLRRVMPRALRAATDAIFERLAKHAPKYPTPAKVKNNSGEPFLAVLGLFDVHFGKLCWAAETGDNYDTKAAEQVYRNAVDDMIAEGSGKPIDRFLLPLGNDFYHIDNSRSTTYAGTPQDVDGRYAKVIEAGEMAVVWAVERLSAIAPVDVVWVPGNHDPTTSYHLARTVAAWFRRCPRVAVDASPNPRKYLAYGSTLIGLTHGNEERFADLPAIMATERATEWAGASCREWLVGHQHRSRQFQTKPVDTHLGTTVRVLRSLAGTDAWHHRKGYVGGTHSAEVYFYGRQRGYAGHAVVPARLEAA
jgi:cob(I)alamin adenosyltransferase